MGNIEQFSCEYIPLAKHFRNKSWILYETLKPVYIKYFNIYYFFYFKSAYFHTWFGVLQHFDTLQEGENGKEKADALLSLYNVKTRSLSIKDAIGNINVRAGSLIPVILNLGDVKLKNYMIVEKCKHEFKESEHFMNLTLKGGEFVVW